MSERKVSLDKYVDKMPLGVASYRNPIKEVLKEFAQEVLELAAENAFAVAEGTNITSKSDYLFWTFGGNIGKVKMDKKSILDTLNQIEI